MRQHGRGVIVNVSSDTGPGHERALYLLAHFDSSLRKAFGEEGAELLSGNGASGVVPAFVEHRVGLIPPRHPSPDDHHRVCCVCRGCPVRLECLTFALDLPSSATPGIWSGSTERAQRRARRGLTVAQLLAELDG
jgi:Transcription factor WhiB